MIMLPVKGPVKTLIPIQVFFKEDKILSAMIRTYKLNKPKEKEI